MCPWRVPLETWKDNQVNPVRHKHVDLLHHNRVKDASVDHFRDTKRSERKFAILHREGELGLMDTLDEASISRQNGAKFGDVEFMIYFILFNFI